LPAGAPTSPTLARDTPWCTRARVKWVRRPDDVTAGERLRVRLAEGELAATVAAS